MQVIENSVAPIDLFFHAFPVPVFSNFPRRARAYLRYDKRKEGKTHQYAKTMSKGTELDRAFCRNAINRVANNSCTRDFLETFPFASPRRSLSLLLAHR